jgi:transposase InsO family protein
MEKLFEKLKLDELQHLTSEEITKLKNLVTKHRDVFAVNESGIIKPAKIAPLKIRLDTDKPIRAPFRPIALALRPHAEKEIKRLMDLDILEHSNSPYHSPAFIIAKKGVNGENTKYRLISDLRLVNKHVIRSYQPLPDMDSTTSLWHGCKLWSNLDMSQGYFQVELHESSRAITSSSIPGVSKFQYKRIPLGLSSSSSHFQGEIENLFLGMKSLQLVQYLDDLATASKSFEEMVKNLDLIFERLRSVGLVLKPEKTRLCQTKILWLGHIISEKGVQMNPEKIEGITKMSTPRTKKQVKSFVSMCSFYRKFVKSFSEISRPLTEMLKNHVKFRWGPEQQEAFNSLKQRIVQAPILQFPNLGKEFILRTDASSYCIGAILAQKGDDGFQHPIAFGSNLLTPTQIKWSVWQKEFYAMKFYCEKFRVFLLNKKFTLQTDHTPLCYWETSRHMEGPLWRWYQILSQFQFRVEFIPGRKNTADCPSRIPRQNDEQFDQYHENVRGENDVEAEENHTSNQCTPTTDITADKPADADHEPKSVLCSTNTTINEDNALAPLNDTDKQDILDTSKQNLPQKQLMNFQIIEKAVLIEAQKTDPVLSIVRQWVEEGKRPETSNKTKKLNPDLKNYRSSFDRLKIIEDVLYRSWESKSDAEPVWLICLPEYYHETVIKTCHDIPASGHLGIYKTLERIRERFYFPKCELQVSLYIGQCRTCILKSQKRKPKAPLSPFHGTHPNDIIQFDLLGPLPDNKKRYTMIFVVIDKFTGWAEAVPLKTTTSAVIARTLLDTWISRNGLPNQCHSDRGPQFTSEILRIVFKLLGMIYHSHTCAYTPKSNGGSEAMVKIVKNMLKSFCAEQPETWPQMLQQLMFAYRTSKSRVTGFSPHFLKTGQLAKQPMDLIFGTFPQKKFESQSDYAYQLYKIIRSTYRWVENHLKASREIAKQRYDNRTNIKQFKPNDWVYLWRPRKKGQHAFMSNFYGPYKILSKVGDYVYKLDTGNSKIHPIVPHDLLRLEPNGEYVTTRDFDPPGQLEWDYEYQFPDIETEQADLREFEGLESGGNEDHSTHDEDRPIIAVNDIVQPADRGRPVRARRPPDRYPGYVLD